MPPLVRRRFCPAWIRSSNKGEQSIDMRDGFCPIAFRERPSSRKQLVQMAGQVTGCDPKLIVLPILIHQQPHQDATESCSAVDYFGTARLRTGSR